MRHILIIHPDIQHHRQRFQTGRDGRHKPGGEAVGIDPNSQGPIPRRSDEVGRLGQFRLQLRYLIKMPDQTFARRGGPRRRSTGQQNLTGLVFQQADAL